MQTFESVATRGRVNVGEAARLTGLSYTQVRRLISAGLLSVVRVGGGQSLIDPEELVRLIERGTTPAR